MSKIEEMISDAEIDTVWGSANFGSMPKREVIRNTLLKCACGYYTGHTAKMIVIKLMLVHPVKWKLTKMGQVYLFEAYSNGLSI